MQQKLFELPDIDLTKAGETIIRALWWKQPFASLMLHGKIETRTYPTKVRGKVLICATARPFSREDVELYSGQDLEEIIDQELKDEEVPNGVAIAIAELVDCRKMEPRDRMKCFVNWHHSRWCWIFENVEAIEPFEIKGKQGWAILTEEENLKIKILKSHTK